MKYTKEQFLKAAELGEVSMIDAKHIVSLLDEVVEVTNQEISDEDIQNAAKEFWGEERENRIWKLGAKWYREQLKTKQ